MILGVNLGYHSKKLYPLINDQYTVRPDEAVNRQTEAEIVNT
jgi:hypothetical protein